MAINAALSRCVLGKKYGVLLIQHGVAARAQFGELGGFRVKSSPSFLRCILVRIGKEIGVAKGWALGPLEYVGKGDWSTLVRGIGVPW